MARPTKKQKIAIESRNKRIMRMVNENYPRSYICLYFGISKGWLSILIKKNKNLKVEINKKK